MVLDGVFLEGFAGSVFHFACCFVRVGCSTLVGSFEGKKRLDAWLVVGSVVTFVGGIGGTVCQILYL